jgi:hypothetical protein
MAKLHAIKHEFVEFVPDMLEPEILYISIQYKTMAHLCCCGCGKKVVIPLSPTGWELRFNGRSVSVSPSVGNWNLPCQSHYVISNGRVQWAGRWSKEMIAAGFARDRQAKHDYYNPPASREPRAGRPAVPQPSRKGGRLTTKFKEWWSRRFG